MAQVLNPRNTCERLQDKGIKALISVQFNWFLLLSGTEPDVNTTLPIIKIPISLIPETSDNPSPLMPNSIQLNKITLVNWK